MSDITWTLKRVAVNSLTDYSKNPRILTKDQFKHLKTSLDKFGLIDKPIVNLDNIVIGGHQRLNVLRSDNAEDVECWYPSRQLTDKEVEELNIRLNKNTGEWSWDTLANNFEFDDLIDWGFNEKELLGLDFGGEKPEDPGAQIDKAEELREKWGVCLGQSWQLGEHRLICGDCTDKAVVERVMGGEKARLTWTDPPYGVNYGEKLESANPIAHRVRTIENDNLPADKLEEFIRSSLKIMAENSVPGAAIYVACPAGTPLPTLIASFVGSGFVFHWGLIWVKDQLVLGRGDYHFRHENILYGWKDDAGHYFTADRTQDSVFEYPRPKVSEEHPTMKPVELVEHMIGNSSKKREIVADPFLGSGTTLIACERLGRKCRAVEISPAYVGVTLERFFQMSGKMPELILDTEKA